MLRRLFLLVALCSPVLLFAQVGGLATSDYAKLLPGKWKVVVAYGWVELLDGTRLDQPTDMPAKMVVEFGTDGTYRIWADDAEPDAGTYRLDGEVLTVTVDEPELQRIEHLSESRLMITVTDVVPDTYERICLKLVMQREK